MGVASSDVIYAGRVRKKGRLLFEKRSKNFCRCCRGVDGGHYWWGWRVVGCASLHPSYVFLLRARDRIRKSFLVLFFKKELLPLLGFPHQA
jgi:hypothetical protein